MKSDENNLLLVESIDSVDELNASFYGRFPYPWSPAKFDYVQDPDFHTVMLNQAVGDWGLRAVPADARIWVAGCGTNQAIFTALKFPRATVLGSDVSPTSLEICAATARALGIRNLELRQESLNHITYADRFDYLICTGVIHHNAEPRATLERLARALKPTGVMELMVYNRFHWVIPVAFQQAIRTLTEGPGEVDFETELSTARRIIGDLPKGRLLGSYLGRYGGDSPEAMIADELLQPVLYSYTVESLADMAEGCGLELLLPCLNQFDKETGNYDWNMNFSDPVLREMYDALPDRRRWQIANLLLLESSPMLWFYVRRQDAGPARRTERQVCEEFLDTVFTRAAATQRNYLRDAEGTYFLSPNAVPYPVAPPDPAVRRIADAADGKSTMRDIFARLGVEPSFHNANDARMRLTTPAYPYLRAVPPGGGRETDFDEAEAARLAGLKFKKFKGVAPKAVKLPKGD
jgi:SAM-dependent methyltransferase